MREKVNQYDIIGDVHGRWDKLEPLLAKLGYEHDGLCHVHPEGRQAIFLGDLIDPKGNVPNGVREVLFAVKAMCDAEHAQCILGNHELHLVAYHTPDGKGGFLKSRYGSDKKMHIGTHASLAEYPGELEDVWLPWIKSLPFFIEFPEFRVVHACWQDEHISFLEGKSLADDAFLNACVDKSDMSGAYNAVEVSLKGVELPMPEGHHFFDKQGKKRKHFRACWWDRQPSDLRASHLVFPPNPDIPPIEVSAEEVAKLPGYARNDKPVFFGHFYKSGGAARQPESSDVYCLDFSAANGGFLAAYRWDQASPLNEAHLVSHQQSQVNH